MDSDRTKEIRRIADVSCAPVAPYRAEDLLPIMAEMLAEIDAANRRHDVAADALGDLIDAIYKPDATILSVRGAVIALESRHRETLPDLRAKLDDLAEAKSRLREAVGALAILIDRAGGEIVISASEAARAAGWGVVEVSNSLDLVRGGIVMRRVER